MDRGVASKASVSRLNVLPEEVRLALGVVVARRTLTKLILFFHHVNLQLVHHFINLEIGIRINVLCIHVINITVVFKELFGANKGARISFG